MRKIAFVRWVDSTSRKYVEHGAEPDIEYIETSGIIAHEDDKKITLALYWNHTPDKYTDTVTIPIEAIKKIRRFKID